MYKTMTCKDTRSVEHYKNKKQQKQKRKQSHSHIHIERVKTPMQGRTTRKNNTRYHTQVAMRAKTRKKATAMIIFLPGDKKSFFFSTTTIVRKKYWWNLHQKYSASKKILFFTFWHNFLYYMHILYLEITHFWVYAINL